MVRTVSNLSPIRLRTDDLSNTRRTLGSTLPGLRRLRHRKNEKTEDPLRQYPVQDYSNHDYSMSRKTERGESYITEKFVSSSGGVLTLWSVKYRISRSRNTTDPVPSPPRPGKPKKKRDRYIHCLTDLDFHLTTLNIIKVSG